MFEKTNNETIGSQKPILKSWVFDIHNNKQIKNLMRHGNILEIIENNRKLCLSNCHHGDMYKKPINPNFGFEYCSLCAKIIFKSKLLRVYDAENKDQIRDFISYDDFKKFEDLHLDELMGVCN